MFKFTEAAVQVVAADSRAAVSDFDETYITSLRLAANAMEGLRDANVPAGQTQRLVRSLTESLEKLTQGRGSLVSALGQLQVLHKHSNQAEVDAGCPTGWGYALRYGGWAGLCAFALFLGATMGTAVATPWLSRQALWTGANMPLFVTDAIYFLGLYALALRSRRYWSIWSAGLQLMCILTHFGPLVDRYSDPRLYRALETFWMMPMLLTMVWGIAKDRRANLYGAYLNGTAIRQ